MISAFCNRSILRSIRRASRTLAALLLAVGTTNVASAAEFIPLGYLSGHDQAIPYGISDDGTVVAGASAPNNGDGSSWRAFRWTDDDGMVSVDLLSDKPSYISPGFGGQNLSGDGTTIVGAAFNTNVGASAEAFINTPAAGTMGLRGSVSRAYDVSRDGGVVVGRFDSETTEAFRWTAGAGIQGLGVLPGYQYSAALDVSDDGETIVGFAVQQYNSFAGGEIFSWTQEGGLVDTGVFVTGVPGNSAINVSNGGSGATIASSTYLSSASNGEAFYWREDSGIVPLGWLPVSGSMEHVHSVTRDMTPDGRLIVGWSGRFNYTAEPGPRAYVWTEDGGMEDFRDVLIQSHGLGEALNGWALDTINAVSSNGQFFTGYSNRNGTRMPWLVRLDAPWGTSAIPEPTTAALALLGLVPLAVWRTQRAREGDRSQSQTASPKH